MLYLREYDEPILIVLIFQNEFAIVLQFKTKQNKKFFSKKIIFLNYNALILPKVINIKPHDCKPFLLVDCTGINFINPKRRYYCRKTTLILATISIPLFVHFMAKIILCFKFLFFNKQFYTSGNMFYFNDLFLNNSWFLR